MVNLTASLQIAGASGLGASKEARCHPPHSAQMFTEIKLYARVDSLFGMFQREALYERIVLKPEEAPFAA